MLNQTTAGASTTPRHAAGDPRAFLDGDLRQVWAVDRVTGQPHYLDDGTARQVRPVAKRDWRCPVPGCTVEITTVASDSRRDHFRHRATSPHPSDRESEAHLSAKAMLAEWAAQRVPTGGSVREEQTVKDPATSVHRIADVMVTWPDEHLTAFEVEYKTFSPTDWRTKQADYDTKDVACVWLLGHTRVKPVAALDDAALAGSPVEVRVPELARAFAATGRHVLVVNPQTRQIGTLAADPAFTRRVGQFDTEAYLRVEALTECRLDPVLGVVTPAMDAIDEATRAREEEEERRAQEERAQRLRDRQSRVRQVEPARRPWAEIEAKNQRNWENSPWRARSQEVWGHSPPSPIGGVGDEPWGIHALPEHWHTIVFLEHVHNRPVGYEFTVKDALASIARDGIDFNWTYSKRFKSLVRFLEALASFDYIQIHRANGRVQHLSIPDLAVLSRERDAIWEERQRRERSQQEARQRELQEAQRVEAEAARRRRDEARRTKEEAQRQREDAEREARRQRENSEQQRAAHTRIWLESEAHRATLLIYGDIPPHIAWRGGAYRHSLNADPTQWHAEIFIRCIYDKPAGTVVTVTDAFTALAAARIEPVSQPEATRAVEDYLYNLHQRALLAHIEDETFSTR